MMTGSIYFDWTILALPPNLLLFITPHVVSSPEEMAKLTRQKQAKLAPELGKRVKDNNMEHPDLLESIWR